MHIFITKIQYETDPDHSIPFQGVYYPSVTALIVQWSPPTERSRLLAFAEIGKDFVFVIIYISNVLHLLS